MTYSDILFEVKSQIAWLTINRPDKGNLTTLSPQGRGPGEGW